MSRIVRETCSMFMPVPVPSGGVKRPSSRKARMFVRRRREEAEGERRMIGSGRRPAGREGVGPEGTALVPGCWGLRWMKTVASFLTCEKSW